MKKHGFVYEFKKNKALFFMVARPQYCWYW